MVCDDESFPASPVHYNFVRFCVVSKIGREVCAAPSRNAHAEFIANVFSLSTMRRINRSTDSGNDAGSVRREGNMIKKLLGAAAMAAVVFAVVPASAAKMLGCGGDNMAKTETMVESMPDGDAKWASFKEITAAQSAMLEGKMGACSMHLSKAAHEAGVMK
jgi:hypothetical protein